VNPETGFLINLKELSKIINQFVVDKLDHKNVNLEVDFMAGKLASSENLAIAIWEQLENPVKEAGALLHCIKLFETERNFVEYYGPQTN
jgi:6-pyruvoyltetrahydropterin/6-carboxytetrahydropterin synthase